jgi:hypothetical protein
MHPDRTPVVPRQPPRLSGMRHDRADDGTVASLHWRYGEVRVAGAFSDAATRSLARLADPPPQRTESARDGSS